MVSSAYSVLSAMEDLAMGHGLEQSEQQNIPRKEERSGLADAARDAAYRPEQNSLVKDKTSSTPNDASLQAASNIENLLKNGKPAEAKEALYQIWAHNMNRADDKNAAQLGDVVNKIVSDSKGNDILHQVVSKPSFTGGVQEVHVGIEFGPLTQSLFDLGPALNRLTADRKAAEDAKKPGLGQTLEMFCPWTQLNKAVEASQK